MDPQHCHIVLSQQCLPCLQCLAMPRTRGSGSVQKCNRSATLLPIQHNIWLACNAMPRRDGAGPWPPAQGWRPAGHRGRRPEGGPTLLHSTVHNNIRLACNASQCRVEAEESRGLQDQGGVQLGTAAGGQQAAQSADQLLRTSVANSFQRFFGQIQIKITRRLNKNSDAEPKFSEFTISLNKLTNDKAYKKRGR
jgi:hypothetical protein